MKVEERNRIARLLAAIGEGLTDAPDDVLEAVRPQLEKLADDWTLCEIVERCDKCWRDWLDCADENKCDDLCVKCGRATNTHSWVVTAPGTVNRKVCPGPDNVAQVTVVRKYMEEVVGNYSDHEGVNCTALAEDTDDEFDFLGMAAEWVYDLAIKVGENYAVNDGCEPMDAYRTDRNGRREF